MPALDTDQLSLSPTPTHAIVADAIRRRIALGSLAAGDRLPTEREFADQLGVSRMTLRAAIRILNEEGLLITSRGRSGGTRVAPPSPPSRTSAAAFGKRYRQDVLDNYAFRLAVEPWIAGLAADRASAKERSELCQLAATPVHGIADYRALDSKFHLRVAEMADNQLGLEAIQRARTEFFMWADALWDRSWGDHMPGMMTVSEQHEAIADAIAAGKSSKAHEAMRTHLVDASDSFESVIAVLDRERGRRSPKRARTGS
jgi:DNA-binding FadR family transcriptional regulator